MNGEANPEPERNPDNDLVPRRSPPSTDSVQGELWPISALLELERKRIDSQDRRAAVARRAIEASDAADQRQYDYHVEKLRRDDEARTRRHDSGIRLLWALFGAGLLLAGLFFWMIFFGDDAQRTVALDILETVGTGLGGFGIVWFLWNGIRRLLAQQR